MEKMTPEQEESVMRSRILADIMIYMCKQHMLAGIHDVKDLEGIAHVQKEVMAALTAVNVELLHIIYESNCMKEIADHFVKAFRYAMYMYDQQQEKKDV